MESESVITLIEQYKADGFCTLTEAAAILNCSYSNIVRRTGGMESLTRTRKVLGQRAYVFFRLDEVMALKEARGKSDKPQPKLSARVPEESQTLTPWGSTIHWPEIYFSRGRPSGWKVFVTCGFCNVKQSVRIHDVNPDSGILNSDCLRNPAYTYKHLDYTGLCRKCLPKINRKNVQLPDGSELFLSKRTKEGLPFRCGGCQSEQTLKCDISTNIHTSHGRCPKCKHIIGSQKHQQSGATVYWLKFEDGQDTSRVAFDCAKCNGEFYVKDHCVTPKWDGKCENCGHQRATKAFKKDRPLVNSNKIEQMGYFSRREGKQIPVECLVLNCYEKEHIFNLDTIREAEREERLLVSRKHARSEIALAYQAQAQNGNGQKNGSAEKRRQEREAAKLLKAVNVIASEWEQLQKLNRTHQQKLNLIKKVEFARGLGSKSQDEKNLENVANTYLTRLHINKMFPNTPSWFRSFVSEVVENIEKKMSSEQIVSSLKSRLAHSAM